MDLGLSGKKALVGGASKGLGLASAQALSAEGCEVAIVSRSTSNLDRALGTFAAGAVVIPIEADLGTREGVHRVLAKADAWGPVDILVNNTGGPPAGGTFAHDDEQWAQAHDSLLGYVRLVCGHFIPGMCKRGWGRVITITSRTVKEPATNLVLSNVYRSAVTAYLKVLSRDVAGDGITVNTVLPGAFRTERYEELIEGIAAQRGDAKEDVAAEMQRQVPLGRFQRPEELGALVAFLASVQASAITGSAIAVDGGSIAALL